MAKVYGICALILSASHVVVGGPVRRQAEADTPSVLNEVTFWKDRECSEINGHMRWYGQNQWKLVPPGTAAVSLTAAQSGCQIFMCTPGKDCAAQGSAYGPIEKGACNVGAITEADMSMTVVNKVGVICAASA